MATKVLVEEAGHPCALASCIVCVEVMEKKNEKDAMKFGSEDFHYR